MGGGSHAITPKRISSCKYIEKRNQNWFLGSESACFSFGSKCKWTLLANLTTPTRFLYDFWSLKSQYHVLMQCKRWYNYLKNIGEGFLKKMSLSMHILSLVLFSDENWTLAIRNNIEKFVIAFLARLAFSLLKPRSCNTFRVEKNKKKKEICKILKVT